MGVGDTFHMAPVGVFFGDGKDADGTREGARPARRSTTRTSAGAGPARKACTECGECMTGCRHGAKNTLNENYLYLAEKAGAVVHPMTTVVSVTDDSQGGYAVTTLPTDDKTQGRGPDLQGPPGRRRRRHVRHPDPAAPHEVERPTPVPVRQVGRADPYQLRGAGRRADQQPPLPEGHGEPKVDFTQGVAITSSIHPDENTHIEPVRYGKGSNSMGGLSILQVPYAEGSSRVAGLARQRGQAPHPAGPFALQPPLVGADHHRPGHAVPRQLPDDVPEAGRRRARACSRPSRAMAPPTPSRSRPLRRPRPRSPPRSTASPARTSAS